MSARRVAADADVGTRWVALLRGVNVGGVTVRNPELTAVVEGIGGTDVRPVLASGNVVFTAPAPDAGPEHAVAQDAAEATLQDRLERGLQDRFGRPVPVVLLRQDRLAALVDAFPFPVDAATHAYVVFSSDRDALEALVADPVQPPDRVAVGDGVVYWACPKGSSTDTPFAKRAATSRFRATTTTRNVNTLRRMA
ncbi:DUF1697 domain-containing protein [Curtobacterium sp. MCBD17_035]|uniref:DUF1697 domain-containing protein n=1 Tax=Curtobacterium sp. MCBD17_035 TaxID=2175673 RepID=UPI000DAA929F|nr:DUF1697 domain-containing protein [Curtobacterium sp. MCBD17_035]WIB67646.1 DUF1697 domain-containing protein [Curtobacterium sp. MCBD17_035]